MRVEVHLIEPPAQFLVTRVGPDWKAGGTNKDLGAFAKQREDELLSCEADKAAVKKYVEDYKAQQEAAK